jgi:RNA polymerase sigma factor (sigma-70 family)
MISFAAALARVARDAAIDPPLERDADRSVVNELHDLHGQALFGFARRQGLTDAQADDAVQETLLRLWTALIGGERILDPKAWAYRVIYRIAMDQHRVRRRIRAIVTAIGSPEPPPRTDADDRVAVWSEVDRLPERQRQVVYLRYRSDLSFDQIGEALGITASAARSHATQAMATLRRRLGDEVES